jgi:molybdopterin-binding protein
MKLSARNILKGKIVEVKKGTTTADELKLAAGQSAYAVIKASDVMIAID